MTAEKNFIFFDEAEATATSTEMLNYMSDALTLQVEGTGTGFELVVEGRNDFRTSEYHALAIFDLADLSKLSKISTTGLYEVGIEGCCSVRVRLTAISSGKVSVYGRAVNTGA